MDFRVSETASTLAELTAEITSRILTTEHHKIVDTTGYDNELWQQLGNSGLLEIHHTEITEQPNVLEFFSVATELGKSLAKVPYVAHLSSVATISQFGSATTKTDYLTAAQIIAPALAEQANFNATQPGTTFRRVGTTIIIEGEKISVPYATEAAAFLVPATGIEESANEGVQVFLVPSEATTITPMKTTGLASRGIVAMNNSAIPTVNQLGNQANANQANAAVNYLSSLVTAGYCAEQLGVIEGALTATAEYTKERTQFGKKIGSFQAITQRLANAYIAVHALRLTSNAASWALTADPAINSGLTVGTLKAVATANYWCGQAGHEVSHSTVHIHGGVGLDTEHKAHRYFLAAKEIEFTVNNSTVALSQLGKLISNETS